MHHDPNLAQVFLEQRDQTNITKEIAAALPLRQAVLLGGMPVVVLDTGTDQAIAERVAAFVAQHGRYSTQWLWDHSLGQIVLDVSSVHPETTLFAIRFEWPRDQALLTVMTFLGWVGLTVDRIGDPAIQVLRLTHNAEDLAGILQASISLRQ
ncbi:MAG TPA: hypothetical protein VFZ66_27590 [Herpetosiphonaceae bacterium]